MTAQERKTFSDQLIARTLATQTEKAKEYGSQTDVLANFKRVSTLLGDKVSPQMAAIVYLMKHLDSIAKHYSGEAPSLTEPIDGRIQDAINYLIIIHLLDIDLNTPESLEEGPGEDFRAKVVLGYQYATESAQRARREL